MANEYTQRLAALLGAVKEKRPLVHHITNYVTVNDCANIALALGASPVMADDIGEAAEMTGAAQALVLNIGTLNARTVEAMLASGRRANEKGIPIVLDPVGAGATALRNRTAEKLLEQLKISVVRGNLSEIKFLRGLGGETRGVDAADQDGLPARVALARELAQMLHSVVTITGPTDVASDGEKVLRVDNGCALLSGVTGTGCMSTTLVAGLCGAAQPEDTLLCAAGGVALMGLAGELSLEREDGRELGHFHMGIIDAIGRMDEKTLLERVKIDEA
ncbi:hydroxyethylthiazole kinase [Christensenellaceae bacterium NSJ-44]|uniref:Hydroxyethylthiazole kinase n=1 Tax=Luoshenia tenuis TaxID=2763654 RepID=A0A926D1I6_9FIRM|nr:hydroxyethylthiazole kinase [Luoshenia tenuis]MBC8529511.1 hydroxyethylthiazole kinase [Luoshenia tenuis]